MSTDYFVARALCDGVAKALPVLIAPVVDFGYYPAFRQYPGSQHLRADTFVSLLGDVLEGLVDQGAAHVAVVNTGVSTEGPVQIAVRDLLARKGVQVPVADIRRLGRSSARLLSQKLGGHADEHETSLMLAIAPDRVDLTKAVPDYGNLLEAPTSVFAAPVEFRGDPASGTHYSKTGARGDPTLATREKGQAVLAEMIDELVNGLRSYCPGAP
jgi:creatinine amidohydrolase/Fe(II)-dependent formamide hydrolase-like protein